MLMQRIKILAAVLGLLFATTVWSQQDGDRDGGATGDTPGGATGGVPGGTAGDIPGGAAGGLPGGPPGGAIGGASGGTTGGRPAGATRGTTGDGDRGRGNRPTTEDQQEDIIDPYREQQEQPQPFPRSQNRHLRLRRPVILSGKVILGNGMTPPEPVRIYVECDGRRMTTDFTNSKGVFNVDLNNPHNTFLDAGVGGPWKGHGVCVDRFGRVNMFGCQLFAELGGYRADPIQLVSRRSIFDNPDVGAIVLRRLDGVDGMSISYTSLSAPRKARKAYGKAFREMRKRGPDLQKAENELETAVGLHSEYAAAWNLLGHARLMQGDRERGRAAFEKAVEADPKFLDPYPALARLALVEERWDDGLQWSNQLLRLNPHVAISHYYSAIANFRLGRMEASKKSMLDLQEKSAGRDFPRSHQILGMIHAEQGLYEQAATSYRDYLAVQPDGPFALQIQRQLRDWELLGVIRKQEAAAAPTVAVTQD